MLQRFLYRYSDQTISDIISPHNNRGNSSVQVERSKEIDVKGNLSPLVTNSPNSDCKRYLHQE